MCGRRGVARLKEKGDQLGDCSSGPGQGRWWLVLGVVGEEHLCSG